MPTMTQQQPTIIANAARSEVEKVPDIQSLIDRAQALSQKVDWWNNAMLWALAVAAIAAMAVGIATWKVVTKAKQLGDVQDELTLTLRSKVATLEIAAGSTVKDLLNLQKAADDAKAAQQKVEIDLAKQRERAAIAERALLELQEKIKPRRLSEEQKQALVRLLSPEIPIAPRIFSGMDVPDGEAFKQDFEDVFRRLRWTVDPHNLGRSVFSGHIIGILIVVRNGSSAPPQAAAMQRALKAIGIEAPGSIDPAIPDNTFEIRIGSKD